MSNMVSMVAYGMIRNKQRARTRRGAPKFIGNYGKTLTWLAEKMELAKSREA